MDSDRLKETRAWIAGNQLTLLVFTTPECGVCDALRPAIDQLASRHGRLDVRYINLEETPEIAAQYDVFAVPVYVLSVKGKETRRFARHFGIHELEDAVQRYDSLLGEE